VVDSRVIDGRAVIGCWYREDITQTKASTQVSSLSTQFLYCRVKIRAERLNRVLF
jgi:hypothetical protein